jgi:hypothetical protein
MRSHAAGAAMVEGTLTMISPQAVVIFSCAWFALAVICGMLAEYRGRIVAALLQEPVQPEYRAGEPIERNGR